MSATCETCRFYNASELECRRHAPRFHDNTGSMFPQDVKPDDWCGEHHPVTERAGA